MHAAGGRVAAISGGVLVGCTVCLATLAQAQTWQSTWDASVYASLSTRRVQADSVLNPDNLLARLPDSVGVLETRFDWRLESERLGMHLRPILRQQWQHGGGGEGGLDEGYLSQWRLRGVLTESLSASLGRDVMNWGPAQFRSPSSPFYFDNGRSDPTRELSGVDALKLAFTPDANRAWNLAFVRGTGHDDRDDWKNTWLLKGEQRGSDWTVGWVAAKSAGRAAFWGGYGQWTLGDDWLLYGEAASSRLHQALRSPVSLAQPFRVEAESARQSVWLAGANHTLESGQALSLEYLFNGHGYHEAEANAYFTRADQSLPNAGLALSARPALLGRHYLHAVWQSNLLEEGDVWRLMWSHNLQDGSQEWAAYFDHPLNTHLNLYALGVFNRGGAASEFADLSARSLQIGLRLVMP